MTLRRLAPVAAVLAMGLGTFFAVRGSPASSLDPESLPRSSFAWNEQELEVGLGNWDVVFPGREVARGSSVRSLPQGPPLASVSEGVWAPELERFMAEQKVAGLIVLHEGAVRLERYALGHGEDRRWTSESVAKSFTSTLVGAAVADGYISSIDDPVTKYIAGLRGSAYDSVSIRHLMTMTSGVRWNEDYSDPDSDIARFYSAPVDPEVGATVGYMRGLPAESEPGTRWVYKTGETHLLGVVVSSATKQRLSAYLSSKLWVPYGMEHAASWSLDRSDQELGGCCLQVSLRDYARFGQFILEDGRIDGRAVVPERWFDEATRAQVTIGSGGRGYGYQWWTYEDGTFQAIGIHGQLLHLDPARRLVVVISSAWPEATSGQRSAAQSNLLVAIAAAIDEERDR